MRRLSWLLVVGVVACTRRPAPPSSTEPADAPRVAGAIVDAAGTKEARPMKDAGAIGERVCRLFDGCDGGTDCRVNETCENCFRTVRPSERAECEELFLRNGCEDRCRGMSRAAYDACERQCRRAYRNPAEWPSR
jgi:hypothetical protein